MKWFNDSKHIVALLLLLLGLFAMYKYGTAELQKYRSNMQTMEILTEKNTILSKLDEKKMEEEMNDLGNVVSEVSTLFVKGSTRTYEMQSFVLKYAKSLMDTLGVKEFKSVTINGITHDKKNPQWGMVTFTVEEIKGVRTYNDLISLFKKIESVDKLIMVKNANIKYSQGDAEPYTLSLTLSIPVFYGGGEGK